MAVLRTEGLEVENQSLKKISINLTIMGQKASYAHDILDLRWENMISWKVSSNLLKWNDKK